MTLELPKFRFHPDPIGNRVIKESDAVCSVCEKKTGYIYTGPFFAREYNLFCPWCLANGDAAKKFDGFFQYAGDVPDVPEEERQELICRTPTYVAWQNPLWLYHCNSPCAFIGYVLWNDIKDKLDRFIDLERDSQQSVGWNRDLLSRRFHEAFSVQGYLFECLHCHGYLLHMDRD